MTQLLPLGLGKLFNACDYYFREDKTRSRPDELLGIKYVHENQILKELHTVSHRKLANRYKSTVFGAK